MNELEWYIGLKNKSYRSFSVSSSKHSEEREVCYIETPLSSKSSQELPAIQEENDQQQKCLSSCEGCKDSIIERLMLENATLKGNVYALEKTISKLINSQNSSNGNNKENINNKNCTAQSKHKNYIKVKLNCINIKQ